MPLPPKLLNGCVRSYDIERLISMNGGHTLESADRKLLCLSLPPWQRPECWTMAQKSRFIQSIFLGLGCGYYVTNGMEWTQDGDPLPMAGWLIDGQQRIAAIRDFLAGAVAVFADGIRWQDLTAREKISFLRTPFACHELDYTDDESALLELYDRLNFGGTPHSPDQRHKPTVSVDELSSATLEDGIASFMQQRIQDGELSFDDIPVRLARYGLMEPAAFVSEMREREEMRQDDQ